MRAALAGLSRFAALAAEPGVPGIALWSVVARLPLGMTTLAVLLEVHRDTGSFGLAGSTTACFALASGISSPLRGRLVDRFGASPVLLVLGVLQPVALLAIVGAGAWFDGAAAVLVAAGVAGACLPPVGPVVRVLWQRLPASELQEAAFSLDAVLLQVIYYAAGPAIVTGLAVVESPALALYVIAALTLAGTVAVALAPACRSWPVDRRRPPLLGALGVPGIPGVLVVALAGAASTGALEVAVTGFATEHHAGKLTGLLLAALGIGSIAGGLWQGIRTSHRPLSGQYRAWLVAMTIGLMPIPLAPGLILLAIFLIIGGFSIAPASIAQFRLIGAMAPPGIITESFTWLLSASLAGTALGNAVAGSAVEVCGARGALLVPVALAALAFGCSSLGIRHARDLDGTVSNRSSIARAAPDSSVPHRHR
ncbi:MFS transporter [Amycolatopsis anabasis]|uniref:MFS transporter n=1 Tax=Amycolatopsis anabasis TaxID=1840409 RepID=UPI00131B7B07|nr:MFS transporter [Amycolatopsis anabasis]